MRTEPTPEGRERGKHPAPGSLPLTGRSARSRGLGAAGRSAAAGLGGGGSRARAPQTTAPSRTPQPEAPARGPGPRLGLGGGRFQGEDRGGRTETARGKRGGRTQPGEHGRRPGPLGDARGHCWGGPGRRTGPPREHPAPQARGLSGVRCKPPQPSWTPRGVPPPRVTATAQGPATRSLPPPPPRGSSPLPGAWRPGPPAPWKPQRAVNLHTPYQGDNSCTDRGKRRQAPTPTAALTPIKGFTS